MSNMNIADTIEFTPQKFATMFGTKPEQLGEAVLEIIRTSDFCYQKLSREDRDEVILNILKTICSGDLSHSGIERQTRWEAGWSENLNDFLASGFNVEKLTPKYYRPSYIKRLDRDYVRTRSDCFEFDFFRVLRAWFFATYLNNFDSIYEFACGSGHNLPVMACLFPEKIIHGLDWTQASVDIVNNMGREHDWKMFGHYFNMFEPDESLKFADNSAIITIGGLEQLGDNYREFVRFILARSPEIVCHIEPIHELYDSKNLVDYLGLKYHKVRKYLNNYLTHLRELEADGKIEILHTHRICFGGMFHDGWSIVNWRPLTS